jgi:hypothetical protein
MSFKRTRPKLSTRKIRDFRLSSRHRPEKTTRERPVLFLEREELKKEHKDQKHWNLMNDAGLSLLVKTALVT